MRRLVFVCAVAALLPTAASAQSGARNAPPTSEQRAELEARVIQRFIQRTTAELGIAEETAARLEHLFRDNMAARRQLARSAGELRRRLQQAVQSGTATDAQFARMLDELETLRTREHELAQREQVALAELLTPRQRAALVVNWFRMQENMRELMSRRQGGTQRRQ